MAGPYTISATDVTRPNTTDEIQYVAAEITTLKAYLQAQLSSLGVVLSSDYNRILTNLIINGSFGIFGPGATLPDLWKIQSAGTVVTPVITPVGFGAASPLLDYPTNYLALTTTLDTGVSSFAYLEQRIEDVTTLGNNTGTSSVGTLTFLAKASTAGMSISTDCYQRFGTGGTPSADAVATSGITKTALSTSWVRYSVPIVAPSLVGKVLGTNGDDYLGIRMWLSAGGNYSANTGTLGPQSGTISIANVQLVPGTITTPYQYRTKAQEQQLVDRYIQRYGGTTTQIALAALQAGNATGLLLRGIAQLRNPMRIPPTVTFGGNVNTDYQYIGQGVAGAVAAAITIAPTDPYSYSITSIPTAALVIRMPYLLYTGNANGIVTADATL